MPHNWSSFISYRHTTEYKGRTYVARLVKELKAELEFSVSKDVYIDERMKGGEYYPEHLAINLCQSVCMVALYWPTYFSIEHPFCSREFHAMETLERKRLALLKDPLEKTKGLIIILALRGFDEIPQRVQAQRLCKNFEHYMTVANLRSNREFQREIQEVATYIAERVRAFEAVTPDPFGSCGDFRLPPTKKIEPWIAKRAKGPRFPR